MTAIKRKTISDNMYGNNLKRLISFIRNIILRKHVKKHKDNNIRKGMGNQLNIGFNGKRLHFHRFLFCR